MNIFDELKECDVIYVDDEIFDLFHYTCDLDDPKWSVIIGNEHDRWKFIKKDFENAQYDYGGWKIHIDGLCPITLTFYKLAPVA